MFAVVRVTGGPNLDREFKDTLKMLRLDAPHNCVFLHDNPTMKGMIEKVKGHVTYGEIDKRTLVELLRKRLRASNNERVAESSLKSITGHASYEELANDLLEDKVKLSTLKKVHTVLRLSPPSKGFKSTKSHYPEGDLGYRGNAINSLLERMI